MQTSVSPCFVAASKNWYGLMKLYDLRDLFLEFRNFGSMVFIAALSRDNPSWDRERIEAEAKRFMELVERRAS